MCYSNKVKMDKKDKELKRIEQFNVCLVRLHELTIIQLMISKRELKLRKEMKRYEK